MKDLGFSGGERGSIDIWERNAGRWPTLTSPWRPSAHDIACYERLAGDALKGNILILGSTPELRDMASRASPRATPVLADSSVHMLMNARMWMQSADPVEEIWVKSDWTRLPLPERSFDIIVGDMVWWVLSTNTQFAVRDKIASLLKPGGYFVSRFRLRDTRYLDLPPSRIIDVFVQKLEEPAHDRVLVRNMMLSALYDTTADMAQKRLSRECVLRCLAKAIGTADTDDARRFLCEASERLVSADWTVQTREEIIEQLRPRLSLQEEACAEDYDSTFFPVLAFKPVSI